MTEDGKPVGDDGERAPRGQGSTSSGQGGQPREEPPTDPRGPSLHGHSPSDDSPSDQSSADQSSGAAAQGRIHYQDPETATPREPTMAEKKARERAERRRDDAERAERAEAARKSNNRRKVMIGSGVTVGVVALVASFYSAATYSQEANASTQYCAGVDGQTVAAQEKFCDPKHVQENGGHYDQSTGMFIMPFFLPGGGIGGYHNYRYSYTPSGAAPPPVGSPVSSPNFTKPTDSNVKTKSGNTISRGGFGVGTKSGS